MEKMDKMERLVQRVPGDQKEMLETADLQVHRGNKDHLVLKVNKDRISRI